MSNAPMRRAVAERPPRTPLVAAACAAVVLVASAFLPAMAAPAPATDGGTARTTRLCPTTDAGAQVGVGSTGGGLTQALVASPTQTTDVAAGGVLTIGKDPIRLSGPLGTAFWGVATASSATGVDQGLSAAPCRQPRAEHWFTGVRSNANAQAELELVNLDSTEAAVNVTIYGADGQVAAAGGRGVLVSGQSQRTLGLGPMVDAAGPLTLQVTTSSGRVAAYVRQRLFNGTAPLGSDWIAPGASPSTTVVLPSVPAGAGARTLVIGNPGDRTAQVKVEVLGTDGAYAPVGVEQVDVPAGSTRTFGLDQALAGKGVALRLTSTRDIVGAVEAVTTGDVATLTGVTDLGASVSAVIGLPAGVTPVLTVANPSSGTAHVEVKVTDASGKELAAKTADVPAAASLVVEPGATTVAVVTITSSEPSVRAAVAASGNVGSVPGLTVVGLTDASSTVATVSLTPDPRLGA